MCNMRFKWYPSFRTLVIESNSITGHPKSRFWVPGYQSMSEWFDIQTFSRPVIESSGYWVSGNRFIVKACFDIRTLFCPVIKSPDSKPLVQGNHRFRCFYIRKSGNSETGIPLCIIVEKAFLPGLTSLFEALKNNNTPRDTLAVKKPIHL